MLPIGIYEKALPYGGTWLGRLELAGEAGFDFVEIIRDAPGWVLARMVEGGLAA